MRKHAENIYFQYILNLDILHRFRETDLCWHTRSAIKTRLPLPTPRRVCDSSWACTFDNMRSRARDISDERKGATCERCSRFPDPCRSHR
ncbi:hypothetical protein BCAR13_520085 [Paraburkholderia caribensis]|nr:hypothetical protein BCAR13_520085 [Paraburkholderia caribensis]